jgi:hypothetical protein
MNQITYDGQVINFEIPLTLTDTGTSISYFTPKEFTNIMNVICPECEIDPTYGHYLLFCDANMRNSFKPLTIQLDSFEFEIPVNSYLYSYVSQGIEVCQFKIAERTKNDFSVLGINFLQNYNQYYDLDTNQMALRAPNLTPLPQV